MAARYWVGGSGTWDSTSTTNWSATSGGAAGAPGTGANVSLNRAPHGGITVAGQHWDGHALLGVSADNNDIAVMAFRVGGTGYRVLRVAN